MHHTMENSNFRYHILQCMYSCAIIIIFQITKQVSCRSFSFMSHPVTLPDSLFHNGIDGTFHDSVHLSHTPSVNGPVLHSTSSHVIVSSENPSSQQWAPTAPTLYFSLASDETSLVLRNSRVDSASLKLHLNHPRYCNDVINCHVTLNIYRTHRNESGSLPELIDQKRVSLNRSRLISFNVLDAVKHWQTNPEDNHGLVISSDSLFDLHSLFSIPKSRDKPTTDRKNEREGFTNFKPVLYLGLRQRHRAKRNLEIHDCGLEDDEPRCCRYPIWVNFADIGWDDWVVAPEGYQGFYCSGSCPYHYKVATNFASVQPVLSGKSRGVIPQTHCSPTKHSDIKILYYNEKGHMVMRMKPDMIVDRCECL